MDFSDVTYTWGDSMLAVFDVLRRRYHYEWHDIGMEVPIKVIISDKSSGLETLLPSGFLFEKLRPAIRSCELDLQKWSED